MLEPDQIHELDCFAALTLVPDESVTTVLTDPPYPNGLDLFGASLVDGYAALYLACKKAKDYVVFFWNPQDAPSAPPGWFEVARHVWHKPDTRSITHYEVIVVWSKEHRRKISRVWSIPILDYRSLKDWKPHPTQKPVKLVRYLLDLYTKEGDTVLDPFVGSGTTAVACLQTGRHCIAIEHNPEFEKIANERLKEITDRREKRTTDTTDETLDTTEEPAASAPPPRARRQYRAKRTYSYMRREPAPKNPPAPSPETPPTT
jgi:DNA modification methylase